MNDYKAEVPGIRWLASYPKSGNTWVRAFLTNYEAGAAQPVGINELKGINATNREIFDLFSPVEASDLSADEVDRYRPEVYRSLAREPGLHLLKVHDAYQRNDAGAPLFPADVTYCAVYLLRNPLDVAVSFSHHEGLSIDQTIDTMGRCDATFDGDGQSFATSLRSRLLSWSDNVTSWVDAAPFSVAVIRYEDLIFDPQESFGRIIDCLGLRRDPSKMSRAIQFSSFDQLQSQEMRSGFRERNRLSAAPFFRRGKCGVWRDELNAKQVRRVVQQHRDVMERYGYLEELETRAVTRG